MPEGFAFIKDWGPGSLLALIVFLVCIGLLVPKRTVTDNQKILTERIYEALEREQKAVAAAEKLQEAVVLQSRHLAKLSEQSEMTIALLQGIQRAASSSPYAASSLGRHSNGET